MVSCVRVGLLAVSVLALSAQPVGKGQDERSELYAWFDSLGFDAITKGDFVRVDRFYKYDFEPRERVYSDYGFVVEHEGERIKTVSIGLSHSMHPDPRRDWPENQRIAVVKEDLAAWAAGHLRVLKTAKADEYGRYRGEQPLYFTDCFVLSRALQARGMDELSEALYNEAIKDVPRRADDAGQSEQIKTSIGSLVLNDIVRSCDNVEVPRATIARRFSRFVEHFPTSEDVEFAREASAIYSMMAKEDDERTKKTLPPFDTLRTKEQVAELIYQLRDVYGYTFYSKGSPNFFGEWDDKLDDKAPSQLVRLGFDAVPQLIEAMSDKRYMRGLASMRIPSATIAQLRDVAQQVLEMIAHRSFYVDVASDSSSPYNADAHFAKKQAKAREWWADVQRRGERDVLIDTVLSGDWGATGAAERLADAYPEVATATIEKAIKAAGDNYISESFVTALGRMDNADAKALIRRYMSSGPSLNVRLSAAKVVYATEPASATTAMTKEWGKLDMYGPDAGLASGLAEFLVGTGSVLAIEAFSLRLSNIRWTGRDAIVSAVRWKSEAVEEGSTAFRDACEAVLVSIALGVKDDPSVERHLDTRSLDEPYVQGEAVKTLADVWPDKYSYVNTPSPREQRRLQVNAVNVWRRGHGLPPLPPPSVPAIGQFSQESLAPLIRAVTSSSTAQQRELAQKAIIAKGLPALAALLQHLEHADPYEARNDTLLDAAKRLSCTVREVKLNGPAHTSPIAGMLNALKGHVLTTQTMAKILTAVGTDTSKATRQFLVLVTRDNDGCGVKVEASFLDDWEQKGNNQVDYSEDVSLGGESIHNSAGASSHPPSYYNLRGPGFMWAVHRALDSGPRDVFRIEYRLTKAK